ncbi:MAG: hypothetical protein N0E59_16855 [Candidatus Thiodiazotropha taylori]|nr:hypothetical protein [Candidatus Thiodiazotropha taylori]MCG8112425.1 hypothetical protein [Candidatus Thiodiazotropha taylori]MCW4284783.1 hypothetical protein [Candidatus Thiodiazotropha taylori]MCW4304071.1 hypothetical protein [Candidatus Thiodiazotropha taylori]
MKKRIIQVLLLTYLLICIYLVTFADIDFKELQNENWIINISYMVGLFLCAPVGLILGFAPQSWNPSVFVSNLIVAVSSALLVLAIVFYAGKLGFNKKTEVS